MSFAAGFVSFSAAAGFGGVTFFFALGFGDVGDVGSLALGAFFFFLSCFLGGIADAGQFGNPEATSTVMTVRSVYGSYASMSFSRVVRSISPERPPGVQHFGGIPATDESEKLSEKTALKLKKQKDRDIAKAEARGRFQNHLDTEPWHVT